MQGKAPREPSLVSRPVPGHAIPTAVSMSESIHDPLRLSLSGPAAIHEAVAASRSFAATFEIPEADAARLAILSEGDCNNTDSEEALSRAIAFAESAFLAPPFAQPARVNTPARKKAQRRPRS